MFINKTKRHVRSYWLLGDPKTITVAAAGAAGDTVLGTPFQVDTQGHFEWAYIMAHAVDAQGVENKDFTIKIFDPGTRRDLMNEEIHAATIAGTARRPGILTETYLLNTENAGRELQISVRNLRAVENNIEIALHGRRWYHKESPPDVQEEMRSFFQHKERTTHYWLTTKGGSFTLTPLQELLNSQAPIMEADDEADTEVFKITAFSDGPFDFRLRELASGKTISNDFVRIESGWGNAEFPFVFQESLLIERNYDVAVDIRDLSALSQNRVFLTFHARRLWYR
ncbi:MAG: hypothetical protein ACREYE_22325 [Gammaproteobacteria bacterium]